MLGIKLIRFPRRIIDDEISLRLARFIDLPALFRLFRKDLLVGSRCFCNVPRNLLAFRHWMTRTFQVLYLIEQKSEGKSVPTGYIGLYDIRLGEHLCMAVGIFDPKDRGYGLGKQALQVLLNGLVKCKAATTIEVEVAKSNLISLGLFDNLGFDICERTEDHLVMRKCVRLLNRKPAEKT
jgi:ribosomal protein S18 acetylase RimI-like enzyme